MNLKLTPHYYSLVPSANPSSSFLQCLYCDKHISMYHHSIVLSPDSTIYGCSNECIIILKNILNHLHYQIFDSDYCIFCLQKIQTDEYEVSYKDKMFIVCSPQCVDKINQIIHSSMK
jgi:hypothetical protein